MCQNLLTGQPFWRLRDGTGFNYVDVIGDLDENSFSGVVKLKHSWNGSRENKKREFRDYE